MTKEEIGEVLKHLRISCGMTQKEVAVKIGRTQQIVGHWETGYAQPDANTLFTLCKIYGTTVDEAFGFSIKTKNFSIEEINIIKKYHNLDTLGQSHVDAVLQWETERVKQLEQDAERIKELTELSQYVNENTSHYVNAAHPIDGASEDDKQFDEDIMNDENF